MTYPVPETSKLRVRIPLHLDAPDTQTIRLVASLHAIDAAARAALPNGRREIVVPAGTQGIFESLDVSPGRYLVQATLPSGEALSSEVDVEAGGTTDLVLQADTSPHEWLDWQYIVGNVGSYEEHADDDRWAIAAIGRGSPARGKETMAAVSEEAVHVHWCTEPWSAATAGAIWKVLADSAGRPASVAAEEVMESMTSPPVRHVRPYESDRVVDVYRFGASGPITGGTVLMGSPAWEAGRRAYVIVTGGWSARWISAPVPWIDIEGLREAPFEVLIPKGTIAANVIVRDPGCGTMLGYMANGSLNDARVLVERAENMLFQKVEFPLAAAAGAYILLETERDSARKPWHRWLSNLREWFPWLPDGAIAHATLLLRHQYEDGDAERALELLLEACRRGVPYYSRGLKLLVDGLTVFHDDPRFADHAEIAERLSTVRTVASSANLRQPFTTLRLGSL